MKPIIVINLDVRNMAPSEVNNFCEGVALKFKESAEYGAFVIPVKGETAVSILHPEANYVQAYTDYLRYKGESDDTDYQSAYKNYFQDDSELKEDAD